MSSLRGFITFMFRSTQVRDVFFIAECTVDESNVLAMKSERRCGSRLCNTQNTRILNLK